ncbi:G patch domain-containing protein 11 isoform X2 [Abrus precatorius]|uniref:G patch domain-containing protein 11 isoform X2 n=1 Tax=Abrus precatorius TaxID=3816 RepID=A0A8B8MGD1_ABRPR|nr:G patch domain-containing protein 11 isoform X2 [Abrus precatorius]
MDESPAKRENQNGGQGNEEEDDYMGDLSQFLPSEPPKLSSSKKISNKKDSSVNSSKNQLKTLSWQERRKLERERKQQEEDEQTLAKVEAPIPQSNIGFKLLKQMGYTPGSALGKQGSGRAEPVRLEIRRSRAGVGLDDPHKEKRKKEEIMMDRKRRKEEDLMKEFGSRQKSQWQSRRVIINYNKAKAALDQLENREIIEPQKNEDDPEDEKEEEEEITEEDLHDVLMKLRDEFNYCLFCGCQYESMDALLANCPGTDEDDH